MEPGLTTLPPPNNELSPDEERILREAEAFSHDVKGYLDTDDGDDYLYESMTTLSTDGQASSVRSEASETELKSNNTRSSPSNPFNHTTNSSSSAIMGRGRVELSQVKAGPDSKRPLVYNAWNSNGTKHTRIRSPQSSDLASPNTKTGSEGPPVRRGGWAKVVSPRIGESDGY
jgi:hypothetical protein